jgi:hypothetical protein
VRNLYNSIHEDSPYEPCKFLSLCIPMPLTYLLNMTKGKYFINRPARLLHDLICKRSIYQLSCNSCG